MLSLTTTRDGLAARRTTASWLAPLCLALAAGLLYSINLGRLPQPDELHHAIAARGLLAHGIPSIAEGQYDRVLLHSWMVAGAYALFGDSLAVARLPSVLCMAVLVGLMFVWLRREAGSLAAWLGTGLFALSPFAVDTVAVTSTLTDGQLLSSSPSGAIPSGGNMAKGPWERRRAGPSEVNPPLM